MNVGDIHHSPKCSLSLFLEQTCLFLSARSLPALSPPLVSRHLLAILLTKALLRRHCAIMCFHRVTSDLLHEAVEAVLSS